MRKILLIILLAGALGPLDGRGEIPREEVAALFREANARYEQGDFAGAAAGYRTILEGGWESAPLFYNLGNAYFKKNRIGPAILYYRKALDLAPRDPEIVKNLEYARDTLRDAIGETAPGLWNRTGQAAAGWLSLSEWIGLAAALYFLTLLWLLAALLIRPLRKFSPPVLKSLLPALALVAAIALLARSHYRTPRAIVLEEQVQVRFGPRESDAPAFNLHEGTEVRVARERNGWSQIALPDGTSGWLPTDTLGMI